MLINNALDGRNACYVAYVTSINSLVLVNDAGAAGGPYAGLLVLNGGGGFIENNQCRIDSAGSSASQSGNSLVLAVNITFKSAFAGNRIVHLAQVNQNDYTSGWQRLGVWDVPVSPAAQITMTSQSPSRGVTTGGIDDAITFTISDTSGYTNLGVVNVLVNDSIDGRRACYIAYIQGSNTLVLVDDAGDAGGPYAGALVLDGAGSIENRQCRIDGAGSAVTGNGTTLTLTVNVFFKESFRSNHAIYSAARDFAGGNNTGWQALGTWSVQ
jgi:hypothetical protein